MIGESITEPILADADRPEVLCGTVWDGWQQLK